MITTAPTAAAPAEQLVATHRPKLWKRDQAGLGLGTNWRLLPEVPVGTEFGRGRLQLAATMANDMYYEALDDAIRAARSLSAGQQGAITIAHDNFVGAELRTVDVVSEGSRGSVTSRPVPYRFEELAATRQGRRELERSLKLDAAYVIDGAFMAVADANGGVRILETRSFLDELAAPAA